jgi:indole-3-glycerol phosphate synthase
MAALVEVHAASELPAALATTGALIGINHRDLDAQTMDMERAVRLRPQIPAGRLVVAESGLGSPEELARLTAAGIDAFLVGEQLAAANDPRAALARLRGE